MKAARETWLGLPGTDSGVSRLTPSGIKYRQMHQFFFDTCFSGSARDTDTLLSARPVLIVPKEKPIPENFTLFSAAAADQVANPLEEVQHGMFSYFLMKGMEGNADQNNDNLITTGELHAYVQSNVMKHSLGSQTPELHGDHNFRNAKGYRQRKRVFLVML